MQGYRGPVLVKLVVRSVQFVVVGVEVLLGVVACVYGGREASNRERKRVVESLIIGVIFLGCWGLAGLCLP